MKFLAFILLFIFTAAQTIPVAIRLCNDEIVAIFSSDEEKESQNINITSEEIKEKKDTIIFSNLFLESKITNESLQFFSPTCQLPSPVLDIPTLPPNLG